MWHTNPTLDTGIQLHRTAVEGAIDIFKALLDEDDTSDYLS